MLSIHDSPAWREAHASLPLEKRGRTIFVMLSTDGFNPFGPKVVYSAWPVLLRVLTHGPFDIAQRKSMLLLGIM
jgi:hypothetical protein